MFTQISLKYLNVIHTLIEGTNSRYSHVYGNDLQGHSPHFVFFLFPKRKPHSTLIICIHLNAFPNTDALCRLCSRRLLKTLRQKRKWLIMRNFSLCHCVFSYIQLSNFIYRDFPNFYRNVFKFVCSRFVVCGRG